jgi:hypothetical protein
MKFDGTGWEAVGTPDFSAGQVSSTSLAMYEGTPYVAYSDNVNSSKATVMKFNKAPEILACSATTPAERTNYGHACTSSGNSCGDTNTGTYNICLIGGTV